MVGVLIGTALAATATGAWLFRRYGTRAMPDARRVAVAPIDVFVPGLEGWRVGLARALTERLNTSSLSAVPQDVVARTWRGQAQPAVAAVELARQTGAGLAVYGRIDPAPGGRGGGGGGEDSLRVRVAVLNATAATLVFEAEVWGSFRSLEATADSLAAIIRRRLS
ncbi:MAG: hypothetical protein ACREL9_11455 [Gemmatimonadales bacterium]